jgi:hypothetical protein
MAKILRITVFSILAAMLAAVGPAGSALAAYNEEISLDPDEGEIGDYIYVSGNDFDESGSDYEDYVYVSIYLTHQEADPGDDIDSDVDDYEVVKSSVFVDDDGEFEDARFTIPSKLTDGEDDVEVGGGTYYVCVTYKGYDRIVAVAELTVIAGEIEVDPDEGNVDSETEISGENFAEDEGLTVEFDGDEVDIDSGDEQADEDGEFVLYIIIPESTAGEHTIAVSGDEGSEAEATFTVEPEAFVSPEEALPGDLVTISGTGFGDREDVDIVFCAVDFNSATDTDSDGSFSVELEVPEVARGIYSVEVEDDAGNDSVPINFTVAESTALTTSPVTTESEPGYVGMEITVSGTAFEPSSQVTIVYASTPQTVATTTSDIYGNFSASFQIPESTAGSHTITASDGTNSLEVPFYLESDAPDAPTPSLPATGSKVESLARFDWSGVSDASQPVTYTLQIATSENFTSASIVLEETGITYSEYTLDESEELEPRTEEEPYYWRVKAVDGAANESPWSAERTFYQGSTGWTATIFGFTVSVWAIIWWCVGCLVAGLIGYSVGRGGRHRSEAD